MYVYWCSRKAAAPILIRDLTLVFILWEEKRVILEGGGCPRPSKVFFKLIWKWTCATRRIPHALWKNTSGNLFWLGRAAWQSHGSCTRFKCSTFHSPHKFETAYFLFNCQEGPDLPPSGVFQNVRVLGLPWGFLNTCQYKPYVLNRMQGDSCIGPWNPQ